MTAKIGSIVGAHIGSRIGPDESQQASVSVAILDSDDPIPSNTQFFYTIIVSNGGPGTAINIVLIVTCDGDLNPISAVGTGWTVEQSGNAFTCRRVALAVGDSSIVTVTVAAGPAAEDVTSFADVSADNSDPESDFQVTSIV